MAEVEKTLKEKYEEKLKIEADDDNFVTTNLRLLRIIEAIGDVSSEFYDSEIDGYEALAKMEALLSMMEDIRQKIKTRL